MKEKNTLEFGGLNQPLVEELKNKIYEILISQGFSIIDDKIIPVSDDKDFIRRLHRTSVEYLIEKNKNFIEKVDEKFILKYIIDGKDLDLRNIQPQLILIENKEQNSLFNWIKLHWSIPISAGYGRRLRYIVYDKGNSAIIGIIGFADPVFALKDRDKFMGWDYEIKKRNLKHVMDAFVLGAVPPYSMILGGKLVASLATSQRIVRDFRIKYEGRKTIISGETFNGKLAVITTASALGKSSIYDRLKIPNGPEFLHAGWSKGSGEFQFLNYLYDQIFDLAKDIASKSKNPKWGRGVRNRRSVIKASLKILGLPESFLYHNIKRELFIVPLGKKSIKFLRGESSQVQYYKLTDQEISDFALRRWVIPRSERDNSYLRFHKYQYSLLPHIEKIDICNNISKL